ncbi:hypothetical protein ACFV24_02580 [Nocardia fluminea]|uniref:hypothetical protein n=1 Tax=Nocardia fluminea TaxID=134984 RepID=UPI00366AD4E5
MTNGLDQDISQWKTAKNQAINGELRLEDGIGEALRAACENYRANLAALQKDAQGLAHLGGYGGVPSAEALKNKFQNKAVNGEADDTADSALERLDQHIEIATLMRDTYAAAIGKLRDADEANGARLRKEGGEF